MNRLAMLCVALLACGTAYADEDREIQERIFQTYLQQASQGDSMAQFIVANRYETGKGVDKNIEQANHWYEQAAKNGHPLAQRKLEERGAAKTVVTVEAAPSVPLPPPPHEKREVATQKPRIVKGRTPPPKSREPVMEKKSPAPSSPAPAAKSAATSVTAKAQTTETPAPAPPPSAPNPAEAPILAKAAVSEALPVIDTVSAVLGGPWSRDGRPAEFLPSALAACLRSNAAEIVCFSQELTRNVDGRGFTYAVKATLTGVNNPDGRFRLRYLYNVIDIDSRPFAQPSGAQTESGDIAARQGWQEPGVQLDCRLIEARALSCAGADRKTSYRFVRD